MALRTRDKEGIPLYNAFRQLEQNRVKFRRGQMSLVAAAPGGFKSVFATTLALYSQTPTIYFSADSDKGTFGTRTMATALNLHMEDAEPLLLSKNEDALLKLDQLTSHIWVNFDSSPSPKEIDLETECFAAIYGEYPGLIVIDNLLDISAIHEEEKTSHQGILDFAKELARRTGSHVCVLCHVTGAYVNGDIPIPKSGLLNKIDKSARLVLTLWRPNTNILGLCPVKQTSGPAVADGSWTIELPLMAEKAWIGRGI